MHNNSDSVLDDINSLLIPCCYSQVAKLEWPPWQLPENYYTLGRVEGHCLLSTVPRWSSTLCSMPTLAPSVAYSSFCPNNRPEPSLGSSHAKTLSYPASTLVAVMPVAMTCLSSKTAWWWRIEEDQASIVSWVRPRVDQCSLSVPSCRIARCS